jgi:hypothetical protein
VFRSTIREEAISRVPGMLWTWEKQMLGLEPRTPPRWPPLGLPVATLRGLAGGGARLPKQEPRDRIGSERETEGRAEPSRPGTDGGKGDRRR